MDIISNEFWSDKMKGLAHPKCLRLDASRHIIERYWEAKDEWRRFDPGGPDDNNRYTLDQRHAWLIEHTRRNRETGSIEMWNVLTRRWVRVTSRNWESVYPRSIRGDIEDKSDWFEIEVASKIDPICQVDGAQDKRYALRHMKIWAKKNAIAERVEGPIYVRCFITQRWFSLCDPNSYYLIPELFRYGRSEAKLKELLFLAARWRSGYTEDLSSYSEPPMDGIAELSDEEARRCFLLGGGGVLDVLSPLEPHPSTEIKISKPNPDAFLEEIGCAGFDKWARSKNEPVTLRQIVTEFLWHKWPITAAQQSKMIAQLRALGWMNTRTSKARLWVMPDLAKRSEDQL